MSFGYFKSYLENLLKSFFFFTKTEILLLKDQMKIIQELGANSQMKKRDQLKNKSGEPMCGQPCSQIYKQKQ